MSAVKAATLIVSALVFCLIPDSAQRSLLSSEDQETITQIRALSARMRADCKNVKPADFHTDQLSPYLRDFARELARDCQADR